MSKWSGSDFASPAENDWPQGVGKFRFPNGVVYEGQFDKGEFHGDGTLHYPGKVSKQILKETDNSSFSCEGSLRRKMEPWKAREWQLLLL